jgi:hypothetical protein
MAEGASGTGRATRTSGVLLLLALTVASCGSDDAAETAATTTTEEAATVTSETPEPATDDDAGADEEQDDGTTTEATGTPTTPDGGGDTTAADEPDDEPPAGTSGDGGSDATSGGAGETATGDGPIDPGLRPFIDQAVAELVDEHGYAPGDITVQSARLVQWRTSAAGCPEPRMQYAQVVTDGSAIELVAGGETYWFHSGGRDGLVLCTSPLRETAPDLDS